MLRELASNLWVTEHSLRFAGLEVGTRMTVIRLGDGGLFLHSPISLEPGLRRELDALGPVQFAVAPNRFHHLSIGEYPSAYPEMKIYAAPGLETKRSDLSFHGVLEDKPPAGWTGQIDQILFQGFPLANEVVFFHAASRTLITTDLVFNLREDTPLPTRLAFMLIGGYGRFGPTLLERLLIRDRGAARACMNWILGWSFDRVIMAHGRVLESGGREAMRSAYSWLF